MASKRHGGDKRGSAASRRSRKFWMLKTFGTGVQAPCVHCEEQLTFETVEADRIIPGGSYRRENVQPACRSCNLERSDKPNYLPVRLRTARKSDFVLMGVTS